MIRPVGEIFEFNGVKLEVIRCAGCEGCYFTKIRLIVKGMIFSVLQVTALSGQD